MQPLTQDAADFRGDVAMTGIVTPPFSLNRGIERLLRAEDWQSIVSGMRDHILDSTTQEFLIQRFRKSLAPRSRFFWRIFRLYGNGSVGNASALYKSPDTN
mmetsp:Transcript_73284/g.107594  ORF Transcript_73284/g.107594 Transcript_73284/m.107594 type:complete len:101 (-) Transcript_73284:922-1224(-)